jgi:hypothetical protein
MKFAIAIGTYSLLNFIELNIITCRHVFGADVPIILSDGRADNSAKVEELAEKYGCAYVGEEANRGHFVGCAQNAVVATAFARHVGADIAVKINQRFILLDPETPAKVSSIFNDGKIDIALPGSPKPSGLITSKFFSRFSYLVDILFMRASSFDPEWIKSAYEGQWKKGTKHIDSYTEMFWANVCKSKCAGRVKVIDWLTDHGERPFKYLRKVQNTHEDFAMVARTVEMDNTSHFATAEWQQLRQGHYMPLPRA